MTFLLSLLVAANNEVPLLLPEHDEKFGNDPFMNLAICQSWVGRVIWVAIWWYGFALVASVGFVCAICEWLTDGTLRTKV
jgi:hypothetical protein